MKNIKLTIGNQHDSCIRSIQSSDWKKLWLFINELSQEKTYITYQGEHISQSEEKRYVKNVLANIHKHQAIQLVVEIDDKIVGSANLTRKPRTENHVGVIGISLLKPYRNQGWGTKLLTTLIQQASRMKDLKLIILQVLENNPRAIHVYQKLGFIQCGCIPNGAQHQGKLVDTIIMYKNVSSE